MNTPMPSHSTQHLVGLYVEAAKASEGLIEAVAIGGSTSQLSRDVLSDLDLFVFCADEAVANTINSMRRVTIFQESDTTFRSGPHLFDGYGICHRLFINYEPVVDLFIVTPATWSVTPGREKLQFVYSSESRGEAWKDRVAICKEAQRNSAAFIARYFLENLLADVANASKMLRRQEPLGASIYIHRLQVALQSARQAIEGTAFLPDRYLPTLVRSQGIGAADQVRQLLIRGLEDPGLALEEAIDGWLQLFRHPRCSEFCGDAISAIERHRRAV